MTRDGGTVSLCTSPLLRSALRVCATFRWKTRARSATLPLAATISRRLITTRPARQHFLKCFGHEILQQRITALSKLSDGHSPSSAARHTRTGPEARHVAPEWGLYPAC